MKHTECRVEIKDGVATCGKHGIPLRASGRPRPAPPYSEDDETDKDLLECPESGQLLPHANGNADQTVGAR